MPEDYDAPRKPRGSVEDPETDSLEELQIRRSHTATATLDVDYAEGFVLPDDVELTLAEDEFTAPVVPMQVTEFRCSKCFLVHPIRRRAFNRNNEPVCNDCAY